MRIGGIAGTSVIAITICAPLIGRLYIRRRVNPWFCSLLPAVFMLVTTLTMLVKLLVQKYLPNASTMTALLVTDLALLALSAGLLYHVVRTLVRWWALPRERAVDAAAARAAR